MDNRRFDDLVKGFASTRRRRSLLKGLLGLGAGAVVATIAVEEAEA